MSNGIEAFDWQILVLLGSMSGFLSGLLGIGGGLILVPGLIFSLPLFGVDGPEVPKIAMATSLALIVPTSIAGIQAHATKGAIDMRLLALIGPSIFAGAAVAPIFAEEISVTFLTTSFILFALFTAYRTLRPTVLVYTPVSTPPGLIRITITGLFGGAAASLLGLGVSWFSAPLLQRFGSMQRAIGTSVALCLPMACLGLIGFIMADTPQECQQGCLGYIYLPGVAAIGISAVLAAPIGASLTHVMPLKILRLIFGLFLIISAGNLTAKSLPVEPAFDQGRILVAQYLAPEAARRPFGAEAPNWLSERQRSYRAALAATFGPRRAFLPAGSRPPVQQSKREPFTQKPKDHLEALYFTRILSAKPVFKPQKLTASSPIPLPVKAIRGKIRSKRKIRRRTRQVKPAPVKSSRLKSDTGGKQKACQNNGAVQRGNDCVQENASFTSSATQFDPFGLLSAPGNTDAALTWSR